MAAGKKSTAQTNSARIVDELRRDIVARRIGAGERITVAELARRFETSGAPVREAFQQLAGEGYVTIHPHRGAVARVFDLTELRQVFAVREALESHQARRFARVADAERLDRLRDLAVRFEAVAAEGLDRETHRLNSAFHELINNHDNNAELMLILRRHAGVARMMRHDFGHSDLRIRAAATEHFELIEALTARDADAAAAVAARHVSGTLADIIECYLTSDRQAEAGR